ncbi:hypothetical protein H0H93_013810 [Arthromyces matolae]|nr:hypothetical protein H0H93_013810 [Arthromyces matolae]
MGRLSGEPSHEAIYTIVNEWEEAHGQALTLTKSLSYVSEMYEEIAKGLDVHGHSPTEVMYTDNAADQLDVIQFAMEDVIYILKAYIAFRSLNSKLQHLFHLAH